MVVSNLSAELTQDDISKFFTSVGPINNMTYTPNPVLRTCIAQVEYKEAGNAQIACALNGTTLAGRNIMVAMLGDAGHVLEAARPAVPQPPTAPGSGFPQGGAGGAVFNPSSVGLGAGGMGGMPMGMGMGAGGGPMGMPMGMGMGNGMGMPMGMSGGVGAAYIPDMAALGDGLVTADSCSNFQKQLQASMHSGMPTLLATAPPHNPHFDSVQRTLYVGNVDITVAEKDLVDHFSQAGPVEYVKMAGDNKTATRYAFVEYMTKEGAQAGLLLNGSVLRGRALKVNSSKNPIVKPPPRKNPKVQRQLEDIFRDLEDVIRRGDGGAPAASTSGASSGESRDRRKRSASPSSPGEKRPKHGSS